MDEPIEAGVQPLQFAISAKILSEAEAVFTISTNDSFFTNSVDHSKLRQLLSFDIQFEVLPLREAIIITVEGTNTPEQVAAIESRLQDCLRRVRRKVIRQSGLHEKERVRKLWRISNLGDLIGFKVFRFEGEGFGAGDVLMYFNEEQEESAAEISRIICSYFHGQISISLTPLLERIAVEKELQEIALKQVLKRYYDQFEAKAMFYQLFVEDISICIKAIDEEEESFDEEHSESSIRQQGGQWHFKFSLFGNHSKLIEFDKGLNKILNDLPLSPLQLKRVIGVSYQDILGHIPEDTVMLRHDTLLIMDRSINTKQFVNKLYTGYHLVGNELFSEEELAFLQVEYDQKRLKEYMIRCGMTPYKLSITKDRLIAKCYDRAFPTLIESLKEYLRQISSQKQSMVDFVKDPCLVKLFIKDYKQQIEKQYSCQLWVKKDSELWLRCYSANEKRIVAELKKKKAQYLKQFQRVPSLRPLCQYKLQNNQLDGICSMVKNPPFYGEDDLYNITYQMGGTLIKLKNLNNINKHQQDLTFLLHDIVPMNAKVREIAKSNNINLREFLQGTKGINPERIRRFTTNESTTFKWVTLLYFDFKKINYSHIDSDLEKLFKKYQQSKELKMVISADSRQLIESVFPRFLQLLEQFNQQNPKISLLEILYEDKSSLPALERVLLNSQCKVSLKTRKDLDQWALLKIYNLRYYVFSYLWSEKTFQLHSLDSFFINYQIKQAEKCRAILTLRTPDLERDYPEHYLIKFKTETVEHFLSCANIKTIPFAEVGRMLLQVIQVVKSYFKNIEYFVAYGKRKKGFLQQANQNVVGEQVCLKMYYLNSKKGAELTRLQIDLQKKSVTKVEDKELVVFNIRNTKYLEWFELQTQSKYVGKMLESLEA